MKKTLLILFMFIFGMIFLKTSVFAHVDEPDIEFDDCMENDNLRWYKIKDNISQADGIKHGHIPQISDTIRYYFVGRSNVLNKDGVSDEILDMIETSFEESMNKWNDIYFYSHNNNGTITKNKIINIEKGTSSNYNLEISYTYNTGYIASTIDRPIQTDYDYENNNYGETIKHNYNWLMGIDILDFFENENNSYNDAEFNKRVVGAHELGHILGLDDLRRDNCGYNVSTHSHNETLMGYGSNNHVEDITYQDLAGVAITRGFHTDSDHRWLKDSNTYNGEYKLICSICNGVKYVSSLSGYTYYNYGRCNNNHTLSSNNMLAVGCNGDQDFIKCKYCRYVAPVEDMVTQNYTYQTYDSYQHKLINTVSGLSYTFYEDHTLTPLPYNQEKHRLRCACGYVGYQNHSITETDYSDGDSTALCIICKGFININTGIFDILPNSITKHSINGSFILPNGVVVLVDEDIQSYLNNTLIFYEEEDLPQIE